MSAASPRSSATASMDGSTVPATSCTSPRRSPPFHARRHDLPSRRRRRPPSQHCRSNTWPIVMRRHSKPLSDPEHNSKEGARMPPAFLITIDTEGDDIWARPREVTTKNARFLPRFQALCEAFALRPTYLVNFEMAKDDAFRAFGLDVL